MHHPKRFIRLLLVVACLIAACPFVLAEGGERRDDTARSISIEEIDFDSLVPVPTVLFDTPRGGDEPDAKETSPYYRVTFYDWFGAEMDHTDVAPGEALSPPDIIPAFEGYSFQFWFEETGALTPYDFSAPVEKSFNLIPFFVPDPIPASQREEIEAMSNQILGLGDQEETEAPAPQPSIDTAPRDNLLQEMLEDTDTAEPVASGDPRGILLTPGAPEPLPPDPSPDDGNPKDGQAPSPTDILQSGVLSDQEPAFDAPPSSVTTAPPRARIVTVIPAPADTTPPVMPSPAAAVTTVVVVTASPSPTGTEAMLAVPQATPWREEARASTEPTATPSPTPVATATPTASPAPTGTEAIHAFPQATPWREEVKASAEPTATPSPTPVATATLTASPSPTGTEAMLAVPQATPWREEVKASAEPTATPSPTPVATATAMPTDTPTATLSPTTAQPEDVAQAAEAILTIPQATPHPAPTPWDEDMQVLVSQILDGITLGESAPAQAAASPTSTATPVQIEPDDPSSFQAAANALIQQILNAGEPFLPGSTQAPSLSEAEENPDESETLPADPSGPYVEASVSYEGELAPGTPVTLTAQAHNLPGEEAVMYQWQSGDGETFTDVEGAVGPSITFIMDDYTVNGRSWRVQAYYESGGTE